MKYMEYGIPTTLVLNSNIQWELHLCQMATDDLAHCVAML